MNVEIANRYKINPLSSFSACPKLFLFLSEKMKETIVQAKRNNTSHD